MIHTLTSVSSDTAHQMVQTAVAHAKANDWCVSAAVVDAQGIVLAVLRMDGVAPPVAEFALDKAYTAATMRRATEEFANRMAESPSLTLGASSRPRLLAWGGGLPILMAGVVVGGIGVSGAKDFEDVDCGRIALDAAGFDAPV